jgi:hypothetical protein
MTGPRVLPLPSTRLLLLGLASAWAGVAMHAADTPVIGAPDVPPAPAPGPKAPDLPNDALFAGFVPHLQLTITPENIAKLLQDPRTLVPMTMKEVGGATYENCSVKIKGSVGSLRQINEARPGLSIRTDKVKKSQEFRGIAKFQLNNCAQDNTYLHEQIAGEMARKAGIPASRCTHAFVTLNGKVQGTYVLKEGFNAEFLRYFFKNTSGHLYDGGLHQDIHPNLECDQGDPAEKSRLTEFAAALGEPDAAKRATRIGKILDIDAYLRYLVMENIMVHGDGYSYRANNYRLYEDPAAGKFVFFMHGMDNVFGVDSWGQSSPRAYIHSSPVNAPLYPGASVTAVSQALWTSKDAPALRERFRQQSFLVYEKVIRPIDWGRRTEQVAAELKSKLQTIDAGEAKRFEQRGKDGAKQVRARMDFVKAQFEDAYRLRSPSGGKAALGNYLWFPSADKGEAKETTVAGKECFYLQASAGGRAELRLALCLGPGRYRLEAKVQHKGIKPGPGEGAKGARLRLSGNPTGATNQAFLGDSPWKSTTLDFTVTDSDPTIIVELPPGVAGELWLDRGSVQLVRLP